MVYLSLHRTEGASYSVKSMGVIYNQKYLKNYRKKLRHNLSHPEAILWPYLKNSQLGAKFRRQHSIGPYIVDFYCPSKRLIIEIDGEQHTDDCQLHRDKIRDEYLKKLDLKILRIWTNEIYENIEGVIEEIKYRVNSK